MKKILIIICFFIFIMLFIPYITVKIASPKNENVSGPAESISVYISDSGDVIDMDFEEYIKGVVASEMPASFHEEALKAQAVAARSYTLRRMQIYEQSGTPEEHNGALTCDNPAHCKAYSSDEKLRSVWGDKFDEYNKKISACVEATRSVIMTYNGEIVNAVFHSTSSGNTESAKDVWGGDVAYLVSVKSEGDTLSPRYEDEVSFTIDEYKQKVSDAYADAAWDGEGEIIQDIIRSDAGGIISLKTGGITIKGSDFRTLFGLRSTNAEFLYSPDKITIHTKGYGHGVGMSQYGANYLAQTGMSYEQILKSYYSGVEITDYYGNI